MSKIFFFHGKEGGPQGTKATLLKKTYPGIVIPQLPEDIEQRLWIVEELVVEPSLLVGSSLGGLTALLFAMRRPEMVRAMVLVAPAVGLYDDSAYSKSDLELLKSVRITEGIPVRIMAAAGDEVIPLASIEKLANDAPNPELVRLEIHNDDHGMNSSLDVLLGMIDELL